MKDKLVRLSLILLPVIFIAIFLYMTFFNAAYDHPGKYVYKSRCANCHGDDGEGTQQLVPPLADADLARQHFDSLPCWIFRGMNYPVTVNKRQYEQTMYPIALTDVEMTNLLNYLAVEMVHVNKHYKSDSVLLMMKRCGQTGL